MCNLYSITTIANAIEAVQDGRIYIERVNAPFLAVGESGENFRAGLCSRRRMRESQISNRRRARPRRSIESSDNRVGRGMWLRRALVTPPVCNQMCAETAALETPALEPSAKGNHSGNDQNNKTNDSRIDGEPIGYHRCLPSVYLNA
jgi:hypothetical protein